MTGRARWFQRFAALLVAWMRKHAVKSLAVELGEDGQLHVNYQPAIQLKSEA